MIRKVQNIKIVLSPPFTEIKPAKAAVEKMLKQINPNREADDTGNAFFRFHQALVGQAQN